MIHLYSGTVEPVDVTWTNRESVTLNAQTVQVSVGATTGFVAASATWINATWQGTAGSRRTARATLNYATLALSAGVYTLYSRVNDSGTLYPHKAVEQVTIH